MNPDQPDIPAGFVVQGRGTGYFVKSRTQDGVFWLVSEKSCSCPAGRVGHESCWHRRTVAEFVRLLNEAMKRPRPDDVSDAATSRFVD